MRGVGALVGGVQCKLVPAAHVSVLGWCWWVHGKGFGIGSNLVCVD